MRYPCVTLFTCIMMSDQIESDAAGHNLEEPNVIIIKRVHLKFSHRGLSS
jgi:hypothetical protein